MGAISEEAPVLLEMSTRYYAVAHLLRLELCCARLGLFLAPVCLLLSSQPSKLQKNGNLAHEQPVYLIHEYLKVITDASPA